jgi:hypothetical protein
MNEQFLIIESSHQETGNQFKNCANSHTDHWKMWTNSTKHEQISTQPNIHFTTKATNFHDIQRLKYPKALLARQ